MAWKPPGTNASTRGSPKRHVRSTKQAQKYIAYSELRAAGCSGTEPCLPPLRGSPPPPAAAAAAVGAVDRQAISRRADALQALCWPTARLQRWQRCAQGCPLLSAAAAAAAAAAGPRCLGRLAAPLAHASSIPAPPAAAEKGRVPPAAARCETRRQFGRAAAAPQRSGRNEAHRPAAMTCMALPLFTCVADLWPAPRYCLGSPREAILPIRSQEICGKCGLQRALWRGHAMQGRWRGTATRAHNVDAAV